MLKNNLDEVTLADLQQLVTDGVHEGKLIEYKRDFYRLDATDNDFKVKQHEEMLKDISSFANTLGGDLIIGIDEQDGVASSVCGFDVAAGVDGIKRRILEIAQNGLEPRVGLSIHVVPHSTDRAVFVVRVLKSPIAPHRVVYRNTFGQFWARSSGGAYAMDTYDLRQAFTTSKSLEDEIRRFRSERIKAIADGQTPVKLSSAAKLILHLIPTDAFGSQIALTPEQLRDQLSNLPLLHFTGGWSPRINLDGLVAYDMPTNDQLSTGYVRVLRNAVLESVADDILYYPEGPTAPYFKHDYVSEIISRLRNYLEAYKALGVPTPVRLCLTLVGVRGMRIYRSGFDRTPNPVDRDIVDIPELEIGNLSVGDLAALLKPAFDNLWNAAGQERCLLYDANGAFRGNL